MILKRRLMIAEIAAGLTPVVLLVLISGSSGPSSASAVPVHDDMVTMLPPGAVKAASPEQTRVREYWRSINVLADMRSPLDHPVAHVAAPEAPAPVSGAAATPADPLYGVRITSIVGNNEGGLTMINGKIYKPGETVVQGVAIKEIDARLNTVTFELADGTTRKLEKSGEHTKRGSHAPMSGPTIRPGGMNSSGGR